MSYIASEKLWGKLLKMYDSTFGSKLKIKRKNTKKLLNKELFVYIIVCFN